MCFLEPKNIKFGKDIKKIEFKENRVIKHFKNKEGFDMTLSFIEIMKGYPHYPKIFKKNKKNLVIEMENCGNLLSIKNLPNNWEKQFNQIRKSFLDKQIFILDLRFMPFTPLIINNLCQKNNNIYLVDLVMYGKRDTKFINKKFDQLIYQVKLYSYFKNNLIILILLHIYFEIKRYIYSIYEKIYYNDI
jgi:hypothetical protein